MKKKVFYPQAVLAATKNNRLTSSAFRAGVLTLDTSKCDVIHYAHNGLSNGYAELHYIFDTIAHLNYAKMQDSEDWEGSQNYTGTTPLKNLFVEVFSRLKEDILDTVDDAELDQQIVYANVYIDIYGVGNRCITSNFRVYMDSLNRILDNRYYKIYTQGVDEFVYNRKNIEPEGYCMKRKFCPQVVKYLSEGLNLL